MGVNGDFALPWIHHLVVGRGTAAKRASWMSFSVEVGWLGLVQSTLRNVHNSTFVACKNLFSSKALRSE